MLYEAKRREGGRGKGMLWVHVPSSGSDARPRGDRACGIAN